MDRKTLQQHLVENRDRLYSAAHYVLRNEQDAEDVIQEAFLRLWRFPGRIEPDKVPAWLRRVVHNLCIDQTRRRKSRARHLGRPDEHALERLQAEPAGEPVELAVPQQELLEALGTLSPETRSILVMHYFQGLKLTEIAEMLEMNPSSVKVRVHRARRALRLVLEPYRESFATRQETG